VPTTWDEYLEVAKAVNGKDMNGDGQPDYGSCIAKKRNAQSYWFVTDVVGSMTQSKGTSQGTFFNTKDMTPLVDNEAFRKALDFLKESTQYGPPDELNLDVSDTRPLFASGRCALNLDWGDVGVLAIDPASSKVIDKTGVAITPGAKEVLNWDSGKLEACTKDNCPNAIDGVNHAPFAAFGGWSGAINAAADQKVKDAAYDFLAYMSAPQQSNEDVTLGKTGFNPYRTSQFEDTQLWVKAGMSKEAAENYLGAIRDSLQSPNMILDLRIPKSAQYQGVVLDQALAQFLAGEISRDQAMQQIEQGWDKITKDEGLDQQKQAYAGSLNIQR
jgi:multiple sugar transport system substrate-binding protein